MKRGTVVAVKVRSRWAAVVDYGQEGGFGRKGCYCVDAEGGWGFGRTPSAAIRQCVRPKLYKTKREALEEGEWDRA